LRTIHKQVSLPTTEEYLLQGQERQELPYGCLLPGWRWQQLPTWGLLQGQERQELPPSRLLPGWEW